MSRRSIFALFLGAILFFSLAVLASAADKSKKAPKKEQRITGTVTMVNKDTSVVTVRKGNIQRSVVYSADTKFTKMNKASSLDEVKEGRRVITLGKFDDKGRLLATRIDVRQ